MFLLTASEPYDLDRMKGDDIVAVLCHVGSDPEFEISYFASAELSTFGDGLEFVFRVLQRFPHDTERSFLSGQQTKKLFSKWDRSVLRVVCEATRELLEWRRLALVDRDLGHELALHHRAPTATPMPSTATLPKMRRLRLRRLRRVWRIRLSSAAAGSVSSPLERIAREGAATR